MPRKFGHEKLNRQEKVWKEPTHAPGGACSISEVSKYRLSSSLDLVLSSAWLKKKAIELKIEVIRTLENEIRTTGPFSVDGYAFGFEWKSDRFARENSLNSDEVIPTWKRIKKDAEERLQMVVRRLQRQPIDFRTRTEGNSRIIEVNVRYSEVVSAFLTKYERADSLTCKEKAKKNGTPASPCP